MTIKTQSIGQKIFSLPLRFEPIYQYRLWGGRRLANFFHAMLPEEGPIGEVWVLSDRDDYPSLVADGPLKGETLRALLQEYPNELLGKFPGRFNKFPLLLKFLDAREMLSVQVHPSDRQTSYLPKGEHGKTEAWVVLQTGPQSVIYAGLKTDTSAEDLQEAVQSKTVANDLARFTPKVGDGVFLKAQTVHSLGDVVVFEVQENSDVTFRLYDWDRVDAKTGKPRDLQVDEALACIDFTQGAVSPVVPLLEEVKPALKERLFDCEHFVLWRVQGEKSFIVGAVATPRILVCIDGQGQIEHNEVSYPVKKGDVLLLPAVLGMCTFQPNRTVNLLEISLRVPRDQ